MNDYLQDHGYVLVRELGSGSFGVTKLFRCKGTQEQLAVKFIPRGKRIREGCACVEREIKNHMVLVGHPGVVQFKRAFLTREHLGIAMEFAAGGELFDAVVGHPAGHFPEDVARFFFQQLISGVAWCHKKGICHRDLKLDNVLLSRQIPPGQLELSSLMALDPRLKICDFGFSKSSELDSIPNSLVGSPSYIAPELYTQEKYNGQVADVWSCGVILYTMLVGAFPFEDPKHPNNSLKRTQLILKGEYHIPPDVQLSHECLDLLSRIFVTNPAHRITIAEIKRHPWFLRNLLRSQDSVVAHEQPPPWLEQTEEDINEIILAACRPGR